MKKLMCAFCQKEIKDDGEFVIKSNVRGAVEFVHNNCHYNYLCEHTANDYLSYDEALEDN